MDLQNYWAIYIFFIIWW